jgi:hypothetical protein
MQQKGGFFFQGQAAGKVVEAVFQRGGGVTKIWHTDRPYRALVRIDAREKKVH